MSDTRLNTLMAEMQAIADGKLTCPCGNTDWRQFLYVGPVQLAAAGCKKCGTAFLHTGGGNWKETVKGPGRTP